MRLLIRFLGSPAVDFVVALVKFMYMHADRTDAAVAFMTAGMVVDMPAKRTQDLVPAVDLLLFAARRFVRM